jgi:hypothetical protein
MPYYFSTTELRAAYPELANTTRYPHYKLAAARTFAEQWFEAAAHCAYLRRSATAILTGTGRRRLFLPHWVDVGPVSSVKVDGTPLTVGELAEVVVRKYGAIEWAATWPDGAEIEVAYTHGGSVVPELAKQAVMMLAAERALPSTIPRRATSLSTELGSYRISQADKTGKTGIPDVDAIIGLLGADKPVTG